MAVVSENIIYTVKDFSSIETIRILAIDLSRINSSSSILISIASSSVIGSERIRRYWAVEFCDSALVCTNGSGMIGLENLN